MADVYVDPAGSATSPYDTWAKALTTVQAAADYATAGDVVYCRHPVDEPETPSAQIDFDTNSCTNGTAATIRFVGCNADGDVDGTRYHLSFGNNACHGVVFDGVEHVYLENFEISSSAVGSYDGVTEANAYCHGVSLINCYIHGWPNCGMVNYAYIRYGIFARCRFSGCGSYGVYSRYSTFIGCTFDDNTSFGVFASTGTNLINCLIHSNNGDGVYTAGLGNIIHNCIIDRNTSDGIFLNSDEGGLLSGTRITNNDGYGIKCGTEDFDIINTLGCYFDNNSSSNVNNASYQVIHQINWDGTGTTDIIDGTDSDLGGGGDGGYINGASGDYNLSDDASLFSRPIALQ